MEILLTVFQIIGTIALLFFVILAVITIIAFFFLRKKYFYYLMLWKGKKNFFTIVVFPFIEWVLNSWNYAGKGGVVSKTNFQYRTKQFFLTKIEQDFFEALNQAVGSEYHIFPHMALHTFLDEHIQGQNETHALRHINQLSADFILCDKVFLNPHLAVMIDSSSPDSSVQMAPDSDVERILRDASFPLLSLTQTDISNPEIIKQKIKSLLA